MPTQFRSARWIALIALSICIEPSLFAASTSEADRMETIRKGVQLYDNGNYKAAAAVYQAVLADDPKDEVALYEAAMTYMAMQDYAACIEHARRSAELKSQSRPSALALLASCQDDVGRPKDALATFAKGVKEFPHNVMLNFNYGVSLRRTGNLKLAAKHLMVAMEQAPGYGSPCLNFAGLQSQQGLQAKSVLMYLRFLMLESQSDRARDAAAIVVEHFKPRPGDNNITLNVSKSSSNGFQSNVMLDLMLGASRNSIVTTEPGTDPKPIFGIDLVGNENDADRTVIAMQTFFLTTQVLDQTEKDLKSDFTWKMAAPLWETLGKEEVLTVFFYHVATLGKVEGAQSWMDAHADRVNRLDEVLTSWKQSLRNRS